MKNFMWGTLTFKEQKEDTQQAVGAVPGGCPHLSNREKGQVRAAKERGRGTPGQCSDREMGKEGISGKKQKAHGAEYKKREFPRIRIKKQALGF